MGDQKGILGGESAGPGRRAVLAMEFAVLYLTPPLVLMRWPRTGVLFPLLAAGAGVCLWLLLRDPSFDRRQLWDARRLGPRVARMLPAIGAALALIWGAVALMAPEMLFGLVRSRPGLWATIMVVYPLLSVYPQEIIFRAFCFHRYRSLFPGRWSMIAASTAVFAAAHLMFWNVLAVALSAVGGFLFARTYERERSVPVVWVEHAIYGCFMFTVGLGRFFYTGAVGA